VYPVFSWWKEVDSVNEPNTMNIRKENCILSDVIDCVRRRPNVHQLHYDTVMIV
jgi:hypothetical protein